MQQQQQLLLLLLPPPPPQLLLIFNLPLATDASTAKPHLPAISAVTVAKRPAHVCALVHIQVCVRAGGAAAADPAGPHPRAPRGPHRQRAGPAGEGIFVFFSVLLARVFFGARRNRTVGCPLCASKWNTY